MRLKLEAQCQVCSSWYWCERGCARAPKERAVLTVRSVAKPDGIILADGIVDEPVDVEVEVAKDDDGKKLQFRVTAEELERIERARGKMAMSAFLKAAALYMAEHVELLTEGT